MVAKAHPSRLIILALPVEASTRYTSRGQTINVIYPTHGISERVYHIVQKSARYKYLVLSSNKSHMGYSYSFFTTLPYLFITKAIDTRFPSALLVHVWAEGLIHCLGDKNTCIPWLQRPQSCIKSYMHLLWRAVDDSYKPKIPIWLLLHHLSLWNLPYIFQYFLLTILECYVFQRLFRLLIQAQLQYSKRC